jgi:predicted DsbA family dithiol-disulfide isomerase
VDAARAVLEGDDYAEAVRTSQQQAQRRGITGVPCYVFNGEHALTGAQPTDVFVEALDTVAANSSQ